MRLLRTEYQGIFNNTLRAARCFVWQPAGSGRRANHRSATALEAARIGNRIVWIAAIRRIRIAGARARRKHRHGGARSVQPPKQSVYDPLWSRTPVRCVGCRSRGGPVPDGGDGECGWCARSGVLQPRRHHGRREICWAFLSARGWRNSPLRSASMTAERSPGDAYRSEPAEIAGHPTLDASIRILRKWTIYFGIPQSVHNALAVRFVKAPHIAFD